MDFKYFLEVLCLTITVYRNRKLIRKGILKLHDLLFQTREGRFFVHSITFLTLILFGFTSGLSFTQLLVKGYPLFLCGCIATLIAAAPLPIAYLMNKEL